jgi:hypothetical protein
MFHIFAHPFDILERLYQEDQRGFEEVAEEARRHKVAFEINADKGFDEAPMRALIGNGNLFSFGGDFHALSYWLKRDKKGLEVSRKDEKEMGSLLGLVAEAADMERACWRKLDPLFWRLPFSSEEKRILRNYAARIYKSRGCLRFGRRSFERALGKILPKFKDNAERKLVKECLTELYQVYAKWGGDIPRGSRIRLERYFLEAPLTKKEWGVYERFLGQAYRLGLKKENFINSWDQLALDRFLEKR